MIIYVFLVLILPFIIYLLIVPIILYINTEANQYYIQIKGLTKVDLLYDETEFLKLKIRVLGFDYYVFPLHKKQRSIPAKKKSTTSKTFSVNNIPFKKVLRVMRSFTIKHFLLDIDTGDCITNSKLYPAFSACNYYLGSHMFVNYQNRNRLVLSIENRPIRLIRSYINF